MLLQHQFTEGISALLQMVSSGVFPDGFMLTEPDKNTDENTGCENQWENCNVPWMSKVHYFLFPCDLRYYIFICSSFLSFFFSFSCTFYYVIALHLYHLQWYNDTWLIIFCSTHWLSWWTDFWCSHNCSGWTHVNVHFLFRKNITSNVVTYRTLVYLSNTFRILLHQAQAFLSGWALRSNMRDTLLK